MKKIIIFAFLIVVFVFALTSCGETPSSTNKGNDKMTLDAVPDIAEYVIVRSDTASDAIKTAAIDFKNNLEELTGATFKISSDFGTNKAKEILFGETSRAASKNALKDLKFTSSFLIRKSGEKIVILGKSEDATLSAAEFFLKNMFYKEQIFVPRNESGYVFDPDVTVEKLTIEGVDISEYSILYLNPDFKEEAQRISDVIMEKADIRLSITDVEKKDEKYIKLVTSGEMFDSHMKVEKDSVTLSYANPGITYGSDLLYSILDGADKSLNLTNKHDNSYHFDARSAYTKEELMELLTVVYNSDNIIIGQQALSRTYANNIQDTIDVFKKETNADLALIGMDPRMTNQNDLGEEGVAQELYELINFASKGGIIAITPHFENPTMENHDIHDYRGKLGHDEEWAKLITPGTDLNNAFVEKMEAVADFLEVLRDRGIPVIFRMLHEENGNWFWWCLSQEGAYHVSEDSYINLWRYIHDYMTKERGLDNLIWTFCPDIQRTDNSMLPTLMGYPGDEYVDIVAHDWYTDGDYSKINLMSTYNDVTSLGKIVALAEFGPSGPAMAEEIADQPELFSCEDYLNYIENFRDEGKKYAYSLSWLNEWSISAMGKGKVLMDSPLTLSLEDVNALFEEIRSKNN